MAKKKQSRARKRSTKAKPRTRKSSPLKRSTTKKVPKTKAPENSSKTNSPASKTNTVIFVAGRKGSGKTYRIRRMIDELPKSRPILIWDPMSEYAGKATSDPVPGAQVFWDIREMLQEAVKGGLAKRVVLQCPRSHFETFCTWAYRAGNLTVIVDEVNLFCSPSKCPVPLLELLRIGRHAQVDLIFAARRPAEVARDLTAQADRIIAYRTIEPLDLKWFGQVCGKTFADSLPHLPEFQAAIFNG